MSFIEEFEKCGYFYQCTNREILQKKMEEGKIVAYVGFDCTAKSLHVGNLMQIMILRLLQKHGHKPIVLIGGSTTKIGDPTGREESRRYLSDEEITENVAGIKKSLSKFIKFGEGESDAIMLNNAEWLEKISYIDFLRQFGTVFSINRMLTMDSVRLRLEREQSLTFLEFNYMLLQAYDFYHLNKEYKCILQFGGSDQWGNIVTGTELIRRMNNDEGFGLTTPLLTTSSGIKMGKSIGGAVWINEDQLSPYDYFQYWRNTEDADVIRFAKLYGDYTQEEINDLESTAQENINEAKKKLAFRVTELCHGKENAEMALTTSTNIFEKKAVDNNLPTIIISNEQLNNGIKFCDLLVQSTLASSKGEAKKLIRGRGARINDEQIEDENLVIDAKYFINNIAKLSSGRKKHILVKLI